MILDNENIFSKDQAVTATADSTNVVDLGLGDTGPSEALSLFVNAGTAFTGTGTISIALRTADALSSGALSSPVTIATFDITNDQLKAGGKLVSARLPHGMKRYADLNYTVGGTIAAGKVTAGLVLDSQSNR